MFDLFYVKKLTKIIPTVKFYPMKITFGKQKA